MELRQKCLNQIFKPTYVILTRLINKRLLALELCYPAMMAVALVVVGMQLTIKTNSAVGLKRLLKYKNRMGHRTEVIFYPKKKENKK